MSSLIWFFVVSLVLVVIMISYRAYEVTMNKRIISDNFRMKVDRIVMIVLNKFAQLFSKYVSRVRTIGLKISHKIYESTHLVWLRFADRVDSFFVRLRSRRGASQRGAVSLYWRQMEKGDNR